MNQEVPGDNGYIENALNSQWNKAPCPPSWNNQITYLGATVTHNGEVVTHG